LVFEANLKQIFHIKPCEKIVGNKSVKLFERKTCKIIHLSDMDFSDGFSIVFSVEFSVADSELRSVVDDEDDDIEVGKKLTDKIFCCRKIWEETEFYFLCEIFSIMR